MNIESDLPSGFSLGVPISRREATGSGSPFAASIRRHCLSHHCRTRRHRAVRQNLRRGAEQQASTRRLTRLRSCHGCDLMTIAARSGLERNTKLSISLYLPRCVVNSNPGQCQYKGPFENFRPLHLYYTLPPRLACNGVTQGVGQIQVCDFRADFYTHDFMQLYFCLNGSVQD